MAQIKLIVPVRGGSAAIVNRQTHPRRVTLRQVSGRKLTLSFPIGPLQVQYEGLGIDYVEIDRPGMNALLEGTTKKLRTLSFEAIIANPVNSGTSSVEGILATLQAMAASDDDLQFVYGLRALPYKVRMTNLSYNSARRLVGGDITQAVAEIQLTERPRFVVDTITLAAIKYEPPRVPAAASKATKSSGSGGGGGQSSGSSNSGNSYDQGPHPARPPVRHPGSGGFQP